ncbi:receptor-type tyrosine-protein phosphatase mu-like isoform X1 [Temnothorax curvispinosus]|uniref:protein-tyrosine-phosphatase n=1 Tax=Temnothorax curvispinosus TaxID=300111 RepID=A0A6J1R725_9HYME|nr:receptor-type tyrosine-protein phosphatase mu-like isoform X1 [Temnothorax curvispinosus]
MKKASMNALIIFAFFIFASQMLHIFGKVTVLRGSLFSYNPSKVKLICLSEDDGGALVWNYNLIWQYYNAEENDFKFQDLNKFINNEIDCKMNANENCLESWTKNNWSFTNSFKTPMGPVFDQRWEEFKQYNTLQDTYNDVNFDLTTDVKVSFSVRVSRDVHIIICNGKNYNRDPCYWIIIGGWGNTKSVIRKCVKGVPIPGEYPKKGSDCVKALDCIEHIPLSESEWRSFIITWNSAMRKIIVYDTDKIIMTYTDEERNSLHSHNNYYMFIRSPTTMLYRFHIYDFLHTTVESAVLTSPAFQFNNKMICVQLLVGLCIECDAHIVLRDFTNDKELVMVIVKGTSRTRVHNLPMWQSVKITTNISATDYNSYNKVIIQLIPKLNEQSLNPLWAIANVRECPQNEALRKGAMITNQDWYDSHYFWPNVTCQKIFYHERTVVNPLSRVKPDINLDDVNCPEGKIGPQCLSSCEYDLHSYYDCRETEICYENGCTCAPGYSGDTCSIPCASHTYGHGCKETCGSCLYKQCNKVTGVCPNGCDIARGIYIPPLCQTSVDKPNVSTIFTNETTILATVPITWKDEYEKISILYSFFIQEQIEYQQSWNKLFRNMTQLTTYFENVKPGTTYHVGISLDIAGVQVYSDWQVAETKCNPAENFDVTSEENGMIIDWQINSNQLYSCPANWYLLKVRNIEMSENILYKSASFFPYKLQDLPSYTSFDVTIFHNNKKLFSKEIRTLEGVPSNVVDLTKMLSANTNLTLIWRPPNKPNGEIVQYEIILKVIEYYGCKDLKLPTPNNHIITKFTTEPTITIPDLHPYTLYSAQVIVHNSRHSSAIAETIFNTIQSEIPSEVFSQLRVEGWNLLWRPPEDCTTISGPLIARIKIHGISNVVQNYNLTKQTQNSKLELNQLNPFERYMATVYVIRKYGSKENASAYQQCEFETPPAAPPRVTNFEVVEIDTRQTPAMIHLRWQSPLPPLNGILRNYDVQFCNKNSRYCSVVQVQINESCDLWDDYICKLCKIVKKFPEIKVVAYNVNVTQPGLAVFATGDMLRNTTPDAPGNYTFTVNNNSVVDLKWLHPWKTGGHLRCFRIRIKETSSNLKRRISRSSTDVILEYPVTQYMRNYTKQLYLLSSTQYVIYIQAVTVEYKSSRENFVEIHTPSTAVFEGALKVMVDKFDSTILLNIPSVLNDTQDSTMHIIVKGPNLCEQYSEVPENLRALAGVKMDEIAWQAAQVSTRELAGMRFSIGDNKIYGNVRNCPLKPEESYDIAIIVTEQNSSTAPIILTKSDIPVGEVPPKHHELWIIPIILFLVVAGAVYYLYQRKREKLSKQLMQDEMVLSQNIENYEQETKYVISNSKQDLSTPSDRQSLSRATTPEVLPIAIAKNDEKGEEITSLVKVKDFEDYVRQTIQSGLLDKQYETFPRGQTRPWDYGKLPQNKSKNRYGNLIAYDETRVVLKKLPDDAHSDYINANYITGYKKEKRYIATQGPKPNTVIDFWRMIWQENVLIICMLANVIESGKTKCEQYWPDIGKKKKYGDIIVLNAKHNVFADYCFRTFNVTCGEETRKIEHLHYTAWPDHGVPLYTHSVVTYLKKLLATPPGNGPVVVHCSAGVGRTGTIILCDICLHRAAAEGVVDVFAETASIRNERANMVDNKQQYLLAHLALVECLLSVPTTLPCNETLLTRIKELKKHLPVQQQRLQNTAWQDEALRPVTSPPSLSERNRAKNRFPELISDKVSRIYLKRYPTSDEDSDYLSAVYVDGVKLQNQYLATQLPMPSTINDFWRMIAEFKVELILMLQPPDFQDSTCCAIAPASGEFKPIPYLNITVKEAVELEYYTSQKLLLVDNSEKPSRDQSVTILCLTEWKPGRDQPPPPVMTMVTFWQAAERIARGDGPTVTLCHDGVTGCGLYLALSFLLERMAVERECDVCLAVRAVRRSRSDFVRSLEHLEYLYDAAVTYLEYFETYANFS